MGDMVQHLIVPYTKIVYR